MLQAGWHIEVVPSERFYCGTTGRCVLLTTAAIAACWQHGAQQQREGPQADAQAAAALTFLLAHEFAHGLARHAVRCRAGRRLPGLGLLPYRVAPSLTARPCLPGCQEEKELFYMRSMLAFGCRYMLAAWRHRLLPPAGDRHNGEPAAVSREEALRQDAAQLKLRVAASLQQLAWQHEYEADALACAALGRASVPPRQWAARLQVLQRVVREEGSGAGSCGEQEWPAGTAGAQAAVEREEEEEAAAYKEVAQLLAGRAMRHLEAGRHGAAQLLLDDTLRWPVPAAWLPGLAPAQRAQLLGHLLHTHPPLARREQAVRRLAEQWEEVKRL